MKLRNTLALIGGISLGSYLIYRHWEKLIEFLEIIGYTLGELFKPTIRDIKKLKRWSGPLEEHGIITLDDLISVADEFGLEYIYSFNGIGDVGICVIRSVLKQRTGKWYKFR